MPEVIIEEIDSGACPVANTIEQARNDTKSAIKSILRDTVVHQLNIRQLCSCGGTGDWSRIAHINMSDPSQQCPTNLRLTSTPVRGCSRISTGAGSCESIIFPSGGRSYSRVCGRVNAYQRGSPDAFHPSIVGAGLEEVYIDGVSLTHGTAGLRQHIWSFVAAIYETDQGFNSVAICSCTNTAVPWPYQVPSYVGNNYFCATGNAGPGWEGSTIYADDPLWDGEGCGPTNACCELNNPPWFCTSLPQSTTDDIEVRVCHNQGSTDEDTIVSFIDIHVM